MIVTVKYFYENSDKDYEQYNKLWDENIDRFIHLQIDFPVNQQLDMLISDLDENKDILAIRFPTLIQMNRNKIINDILLGKGIKHNNKIWQPKEIWIYNPV